MKKLFICLLILGIHTFLCLALAQENKKSEVNALQKHKETKNAEIKYAVFDRHGENEVSELSTLTKEVLTISGDTVKYVGIIAGIILPFILALFGFQIFKSYQFEREIRDTRKLMLDEYHKVVGIRSETEKIANETKSNMQNLEQFVGQLATDFLNKKTPELSSEYKGLVEEGLLEIKKKDEELSKSIELMKRLETLDLTLTPTVYLERGVIYCKQENYIKAIENFNKVIELEPNNKTAYFERARAYGGLKKYDDAILDYTKAIALDPIFTVAYTNRGLYHRLNKKFEESLRDITKAIELNKTYDFAYFSRGETYRAMGKYDLAINDYKEAVKLNPKRSEAFFVIGISYGKMKNFGLAVENYLKYIDKKKTVSGVMNLAEAYICNKDYSNAEKWASEGLSISDDIYGNIMSRFLLTTALILGNKEYKIQLQEMVDTLKEGNFEIGTWSFDELTGVLNGTELQPPKMELIKKMIDIVMGKVHPEDFKLE